jgi:rhomboid family GlyGly-CTERM serine protease
LAVVFSAPVTATVIAASLLILLVPPLGSWLQLDRSLVGEGQLWRLVTCHLTHWGFGHYLWDAVVFAVLGALCETRQRRGYAWRLATSAIMISVVVLAADPGVQTYRGLSGVDTVLYVLVAGTLFCDSLATRSRSGVLLSTGLSLAVAAKIVFECLTGDTLFVQEGNFAVAQSSHIAGAAAGLLWVLTPLWRAGVTQSSPCTVDSIAAANDSRCCRLSQ